jgi:hypothetical protein
MLPVLLLLAAAPHVAMPALQGSEVGESDLRAYAEKLSDMLEARGALVLGDAVIDEQLGHMRPDCPLLETPCMTQLGSRLGVDAVITGSVRSTGFDLQIDLQLLSRKGGLTPFSARASSSSDVVLAMGSAANAFADALGLKHLKPVRSPRWWVPAAIGGGLLIIAGSFALATSHDAQQLEGASILTLPQAQGVYAQGKAFETTAIAGTVLGVVGLAVSLVWLLITTSPAP